MKYEKTVPLREFDQPQNTSLWENDVECCSRDAEGDEEEGGPDLPLVDHEGQGEVDDDRVSALIHQNQKQRES